MDKNRHFNVVVAGENHKELMEKYDSSKEIEPYLVFEFSKKKEYRAKKIKILEDVLKSISDKDTLEYQYFEAELDAVKSMDDFDYYLDMTSGDEFEVDEMGNAYAVKNLDGKFDACSIAKNFAVPFKLKNGEEAFSAKKSDIDWKEVHLGNREPYEIAWDTVVEHKAPKTEEEKAIYNNMKERLYYFSLFKNREHYIKSNTAFWGYAFLSEKTGWVELDERTDQFDWVCNFYDKFIKPLPNNETITIYECFRA